MTLPLLKSDDAQQEPLDQVFAQLQSSAAGLSHQEALHRLDHYGPNRLPEHKQHPLLRFLGYFWGPIPWMIEVAAVLSAVVQHWTDLGVILALLLFNAGVGFWQERKAANALDALKAQLALQARVRRDGQWQAIEASALVPGDVIQVRLGDIIPADAKIITGEYLSVDQSALTGESLPVEKHSGDLLYSGAAAKQGEVVALVTGTGANTFLGRTARLVESAGAVSHFQRAVLHIGDYLIYLSLGLVVILIIVQLFRGASVLTLIQFALILTVASIPVAMPAVLSVTMAVGALALSHQKAIVARLESIEEMAGMNLLCSDKTGTLTQNRLTLGTPVVFAAADPQEVILAAALASEAETTDPIDQAVLAGVHDQEALHRVEQVSFVPFDPVHKRTEATVTDAQRKICTVTKGAPQVILRLAQVDAACQAKADQVVQALAAQGYRTLGVARAEANGPWQFLGILPLFDPPRADAAETIAQANQHGIEVKMVTGDNVAIARQIAGQLGLGTNILPAEQVFPRQAQGEESSPARATQIEQADGFAQVFPEHKYGIVKALQHQGHLVGMTGDGVNDAPALRQAEVGIAVSGATDAARAAAALVLTAPGLSVIIRAVEEARRIFERMNSYAIYRITETIRIMVFIVLTIIALNFYPITAIMIILLAFFNDIPIMTIAVDHTWLDPQPVRWEMRRILTVATTLGLIGVIETFGILLLARLWLHLAIPQVQTFIFLKLAIAGHLTLFVARTRRPFWSKPYPAPALFWSAVGTKLLATAFVIYPLGLMAPLSWADAGIIWLYCLIWVFIEDWAKLEVYHHFHLSAPRHRRFLALVKHHIFPHVPA